MTRIDRQAFEAPAARIRSDRALAHTQALAVSQHGRIVFERHFRGAPPGEPTDVFSTESWVAHLGRAPAVEPPGARFRYDNRVCRGGAIRPAALGP